MSTPAATIDQHAPIERLNFGQGILGIASRFAKTSPIGAVSALFLILLMILIHLCRPDRALSSPGG